MQPDALERLRTALDQQLRQPVLRTGETLIRLGLIDAAQLEAALERQKSEPTVPIGQWLMRLGGLGEHDLKRALRAKLGCVGVDLEALVPEPAALRLVLPSTAQDLKALPLMQHRGQLVIALEDPLHAQALQMLSFASGLRIWPVMAEVQALEVAIARAYRLPLPQAVDQATMAARPFTAQDHDQLWLASRPDDEAASDSSTEDAQTAGPAQADDSSLVRLVHTMIIDALNSGASDIHIECSAQPPQAALKVRMRRDGQLGLYAQWPAALAAAVITRLKIMAELDISERRRPQDGKIRFERFAPGHELELRMLSMPTSQGAEDVVLRLLGTHHLLTLDELGLERAQLSALREMLQKPHGLILCAGPTGSGKTTTLHAALAHLNAPERKIWTAEDPIEITQPGLRQVQVQPRIGWTFDQTLRALLRADPDVIMVGEIRDRETARTAIEAALTGHLVMSTIHTNSAVETINRLLDLGVDPFNFADTLMGVVSQRLLRRLCPACSVKQPADGSYREALIRAAAQEGFEPLVDADRDAGAGEALQRHLAAGCKACAHTGYRGRIAVHEVLPVSPALRRSIQSRNTALQLQELARAQGHLSLRSSGVLKVLSGLTTLEEVHAATA